MQVPEIPILRRGTIYRSLDIQQVNKLGTGDPAVRVHMANSGLVKRDLMKVGESRKVLEKMKCADLVAMIRKAGDYFLNDALPVGDSGQLQAPEDYVRQLASTSGLPHALIRMNMKRLYQVFDEIEIIIKGLSRGLDLEVLDRGYGTQNGVPVSYAPLTDSLAVILPSNSPAVNALWIPALAMKTPVVLKPGREEPWTPWRVIQSMIKAGIPIEAFSFFPTDHEGSGAIMRRAGRVMMFGDDATVAQYANDPRVEVHGTGHSKILLGDDEADNWEKYLDLMVESVSANSGRSCINVSTIMTPRHSEEIAMALAERLTAIRPLDAEDPEAKLSGFANPKFAEYIDGAIEGELKSVGARDLSIAARNGEGRFVEREGMNYLLPTVIHCASVNHPLANKEYLFPFCSVVEIPQDEMLSSIGYSLVATAITSDKEWSSQLLASADIERLNLGPVPTNRVSWDQPHEGNLFEFLYKRRSFQLADAG